jgi:large subunit ribosomal protein L24
MPRTKNKQKKLHVKKGDIVALTKAITSSEALAMDRAKGYQARVLKVYRSKEKVLVEGVNVRYKHTKPNQANPNGGRIEAERPIHASNVLPVDSNGKPTRVGRKLVTDPETGKGRWVRVAKTTGLELDR